MENRRNHYRHRFPALRQFMVTLTTADGAMSVTGVLVNLSVGGICVRLRDGALPDRQSWTAHFMLEPDTIEVRLRIERIYTPGAGQNCYGFRFLIPAAIRDEQERLIWRFLLDEQRRERRQAQEASRKVG